MDAFELVSYEFRYVKHSLKSGDWVHKSDQV
jgi:hypothetical protein